MGLAGREIGLQFELHALWEKSGGDASAYRLKAEGALREDIEACRAAAEHFRGRGQPAKWPAQYEAKASAIEVYLGQQGQAGGADRRS